MIIWVVSALSTAMDKPPWYGKMQQAEARMDCDSTVRFSAKLREQNGFTGLFVEGGRRRTNEFAVTHRDHATWRDERAVQINSTTSRTRC